MKNWDYFDFFGFWCILSIVASISILVEFFAEGTVKGYLYILGINIWCISWAIFNYVAVRKNYKSKTNEKDCLCKRYS